MFRLVYPLVIGIVIAASPGRASDLGTAGPFRMIGGTGCPAGTADQCNPPPVDSGLPRDAQVSAHIARALKLLDLVHVAEAREALDVALKLDPDNVRALTLRGRMAETNGDVSGAQADIDHALLLAPGDPDLLATRGSLASTLCECQQGLKDLGIALAKKPDDIDALFIRARLYRQFNDIPRAFTDLTTLLSVEPNDTRARLMRAGLQLARNDYELAALDAKAVLAREPYNSSALLLHAKARSRAGDNLGAIEDYTMLFDAAGASKALFIPDFRDAMIDRARLFAKLNNKEAALRDLGSVIDQGGKKAVLRLQLFLRSNGFPNVEITGTRSVAFDTVLATCFADSVCGPTLKF